MLKSKFARKDNGFRAQKIFTDRKPPQQVLQESLQQLEQKPLQIINYYGKGGIGKSRLLKELFLKVKDFKDDKSNEYTFVPIFISLDAYDYANPVNILTTLRNSINGDCSLFDYAMTLYCAKAKITIEDIKDRNWALSNNILEHINDVLALATLNAAIPLKWIGTALFAIRDYQFKKTYQAEVKELATLNEFQIFERLPYYLGLCLQQAALERRVHILFLDSYESFLVRTYGQTPSVECDDWLRELFLTASQMRLVIASRDKLKWEDLDPEWGDLLNQHRLNNLSDDDARWFLQQVPIHDAQIIDFIVANSKGVPLHLDMCVDVYESLFNTYQYDLTNEIYQQQGNFYNVRGKIIIDRYLKHLTHKQHSAVKVMSVLRAFNQKFAMKLLQQMNLPYYHDELAVLLDKSIILSLDEKNDTWKLDESIRELIWRYLSVEEKRELISGVLTLTSNDVRGQFFTYFANILELIIADPSLIADRYEDILMQVEAYGNGGYWNELHGILASHTEDSRRQIAVIAIIGEAICLRRYGRLHDADVLLSNHPLQQQELGHFYYYYRYLRAQIRHLLGHYNEAIKAYKEILDEMTLIKSTLDNHIYVQTALKHADLLYLKGQFDEALKHVDHLLDQQLTPFDQVEVLRIKGHVYRFQLKFAKARLIYSSAMDLVHDSKMTASIGKLLTNYIEVNCIDQPQQALKYYVQAIETNHDNDVELCKCYAAAAVAYIYNGDSKQALENARLSLDKAVLSGYQSGEIFAFGAYAIVHHMLGDPSACKSYLERLNEKVNQLGVYLFVIDIVKKLCTE